MNSQHFNNQNTHVSYNAELSVTSGGLSAIVATSGGLSSASMTLAVALGTSAQVSAFFFTSV